MIKSNKGVSLISLIITIAVMTIIATITINISLDRFEINNLNKMLNDLELLADKVSNYYLKYNAIPVLRNESDNTGIKYIYTILNFDKDVLDNENYYIIDLKVMDGISLNYGEEGFENPNTSDDVYIINENSHQIYYVKVIELDGELYHSILVDNNNNNQISINNDKIPPTKPQMKMVSGETNEQGVYTTAVSIEFVPGKDNGSGVEKTTYSVNDEEEKLTSTLPDNTLTISENGTYNIKARSYDMANNVSDKTEIDITIQNTDVFFITKWNVKDNETGDTTVVLPIHQSSTYDAVIHWGDGESTPVQWQKKSGTLTEDELSVLTNMVTHTYSVEENDNAERTISIEGIYPDFRMGTSTSTPTKLKLTKIEQWGNIGLTSLNFKDCTNLGGGVPKPNREDSLEKCTSFQYCFYNTGIQSLEEGFSLPNNIGGKWCIYQMFYDCGNLVSIPESFQIPPNVTSAAGLFRYCTSLESLPESFNIHSGITDMSSMFANCTSLKKLPTNFYIPSGCTNVGGIVSACASLEELPSGFILPENYSGSLQNFFRDCTNLKTLPDGFTIPKGATNLVQMFQSSGIERLPDSFSIPESYTGSINHMFYNCQNLEKIPDDFTIPEGVTNITFLFGVNRKLKGSIKILGNPATYGSCFSNTAIESGGTLTVNYSSNCTNIDAILKTGNASYVVKGSQVD